jgi:UDP-N-acetylmuramyl tripeptide synthase
MGSVAAALADQVIVTSDNPRSESPEAIIAEVLQGMNDAVYQVQPDRAQAIKLAILSAQPGDIVLLAGKGHETYQEVAGVKQPFDDVEQAGLALQQYRMTQGVPA